MPPLAPTLLEGLPPPLALTCCRCFIPSSSSLSPTVNSVAAAVVDVEAGEGRAETATGWS